MVLTGGVGHALVGGALFGIHGAVAGSLLGSKEKKEIKQLNIKITLNSFDTPSIIIQVIQKPLKLNSKEYKKVLNQANEILTALDIISHRQNKN